MENSQKINASKYRKVSDIREGDRVLVRNSSRKSKFDPIFWPHPFIVVHCDEHNKSVIVENDSHKFTRHLDDVKRCHLVLPSQKQSTQRDTSEESGIDTQNIPGNEEDEYDDDNEMDGDNDPDNHEEDEEEAETDQEGLLQPEIEGDELQGHDATQEPQCQLRRSQRQTKPNPKYNDFKLFYFEYLVW